MFKHVSMQRSPTHHVQCCIGICLGRVLFYIDLSCCSCTLAVNITLCLQAAQAVRCEHFACASIYMRVFFCVHLLPFVIKRRNAFERKNLRLAKARGDLEFSGCTMHTIIFPRLKRFFINLYHFLFTWELGVKNTGFTFSM